MNSYLVVFVLASLYGYGVYGQTVEMLLDDGVSPVDDGKTQVGQVAQITCTFGGGLTRVHKTALEYSEDGTTWQQVALTGQLQGPWAAPEAYTIEETPTATTETYVFRILSTKMDDEGTYKCLIFTADIAEVTSAEKSITIYAQTSRVTVLDTTDGAIKATAGDPTTIRCEAVNGSQPQMQLKVAGVVVNNNLEVTTDPGSNIYSAVVQHTFTEDDDGKEVSCTATVPTFDQAVEGKARLQIFAKPTVTCDPATQAIAMGNEARYTCIITGKPLPRADQIMWFAENGQQLAGNGDEINFGWSSEVVPDPSDPGNKLQVTLTVTVQDTNSPNTFTITATNSDTSAAATAEVKLTKPGQTNEVGDGGGDGNTGTTITCSIALHSSLLFMIAAFVL